jgi:TP901 family phage tail tape measure protein
MAQGNNLQINVVASVRAAQKQINALVSQPYTLNLTTKGGGISAPLGKIKGQLGEFEKSLEASNARVIAFGASASAIYAVNTALRESVKASIEVEKALKDINVILNLTDKSLGQFGQSLFDIAKNTGNSFSTVAAAATELSRQGLGVSETLKRTQDALILTRLSGLDAVSSVEALTASLNGFQKAALTSTEIINKLAAVDASFAVSSGDLAEAIKRVGSSAEDAGISFDELIGIVTATQQITARGGAVIGNSFKTIFTRLQRTETLDALEQLGIQTKTTEGNIRPLIQILSELGKTFDTLNDVQKAAVAEQVGGVFQINILKAALGDLNKEYSVYTNALNISRGATDEAIRRNEELNTTLAALLNKTIANLTAAGAKIGELSLAPALKKVFGGLNTILESFTAGDSEDIGNKIGEGLLKGLGNFLSGPGLIIGAKILFGIFERLTVFTADAIKSLSGLNAQGAQQAQIQQQIFTILQKNPQIISQIVSGQTTLQSVQNAILTTIQAQTLQMQQQVTLSKSLATSLAAAGVSISRTGSNAGRLQITAGGFVPNLFNQEESSARKMGASNPKAQISAGTIGGQKFIKNNKELEIVGLGKNGDSAVIPTYGSVGNKRQKELYDKLKFLGFVPNFAGGQSVGTQAYKLGIERENLEAHLKNFPLSEEQKDLAFKAWDKANNAPTGTKTIEASNTAIISPTGQRKSVMEANYSSDLNKNPLKTRFVGIHGIVPEALTGDDFAKFDKVIEDHLPQAMIGIANELSKGVSPGGGYPNKTKIAESIRSDTSGYPQIAGRIFEVAIQTAINKQLQIEKSQGDKGNRTWDFGPDDFGLEAGVARAIFGDDQAAILMSSPYIDAKRSPVGSPDTNASLKSKFFNTPYFQQKIKSAKAMARGYIPNFAGIRTAMQAEKKMGGNPALDFQDGIGLYVRDRKTQSNFSAVKRDHPEGIGQAIKNSKIAQETLAKGFIPNFIAPGQVNPATGLRAPAIPNAAGSAPAPINTQPAQKALTDYTNKVLLASVAFSTMSGLIESFTKDSESNLGKMSSAVLNGVGTFASIAAVIPGPIGLVAGGLVGAYQAISGVMEIMRDQTGPIKKGLEQAKEGLSKLNDATQSYAQTYEKLQAAYEDTSKSPQESAKIIQKLEKDLSSALAEMPSAYRDQLKSAQNLTDIQEIIAKSLAENAKKIKQEESALGLANQITKEGTAGAFKEGGDKKAVEKIFAGINPEKQGAFFEKYQKGEIQGLKTRKLADGTESLIGGTEDIINVFKELGASELELSQISRMGVLPLSQLQKELKNQTDATIKNNKESAEVVAESDKRIKASLAEKEAKRKETEAARKAAEAAGITAEANRQVAISELKLADARKSNISKIATEAASSELQTAQPFTTAKGIATGQAGVEAARRFSAAETQRAQARTQSIGKISSDFSNSIGKAIDEGLKGGKNVEELQKGKSKIAGIVKEGGGPEVIAQKLEALGKALNLEDLMNLQSDTEAELKTMASDMALIDEDLKTGNIIAEKQLAEQIKQIRNQERTKALGGMQGFLDPESLKGPIEKLLGGFEKAQVGKKFGLEMTGARGIAEAGMAALELTGGAGSAKMNAGLKNAVVPQQTKFVEQTFNDLAAQAEATGTEEGKKLAEVFKEQAADAKNIAEAQFDAAFQKEQLPQNVAKILEQVIKIASGDNQADAAKQGIKDATKIGTGSAGAIDTGKSILSGLSTPPKTATTISGKPLFGEKETSSAGQTVPTTSTVAGTNQAQKTIAKREFSPDINQTLGIGTKGALTSAEAEKYKAANMAEQDRLRQQEANLSVKAAKGDTTAKTELEQTKNKISKLGERYKGAEGIAQTLAYGERPVKAGAESMAEKVGRTRAAEMQSATQQGGRGRQQEETKSKGSEKTSKGEVNVSFSPISVDIKGSVETANDELSQKMTDAIKQAVEQIAPGIISKIYGPPRDSGKT